MVKGLHKVFKTVVKYISQYFPPLGEYGSEVWSDKIVRWHKETLAKGNSEVDWEFNQQSDFSCWRSRERWACDSMHGCLQS